LRVRFFGCAVASKLGELASEAETAQFLETVSLIDAFWRSFRRGCRDAPGLWLPRLRAQLSEIAPGLGLELRAGDAGTETLCLVPLDGPSVLPLAELMAERAPCVVPWVVQVGREPLSLNQVLACVHRDHGYDLTHARARVGVGRGHLIEVMIAHQDFAGAVDERAAVAAEALVQGVMGDRAYDQWIHQVQATAAPRHTTPQRGGLRLVGEGSSALPLGIAELVDSIEAAGRGVLLGLPERPCHEFCEKAAWVMFELDADDGEEHSLATSGAFPSRPQADLRTASTMCPEMLKSFLSGAPFASARFSRNQERFCYLQLKSAESSDAVRQEQRTTLEDELDPLLVPGRLGCVVGAGLGTHFAYIYLALQNVESAVPLLRRAVQGALPSATSGATGQQSGAWLMFCDDEWRHEWVSLLGERPPPGLIWPED
jgi:hypothetical protein